MDAGPVDLFASSGGAINALALVARHPEQVRTLIAHEPPAAALVPDREFALAACRDIHDTYQRSGMGPAMAKFIAIVSHKGPITADYLEQPAPDPAMFGLPAEDDGSRDDVLLGRTCCPARTSSPTSTRCGRRDPRRHRGRRGVRRRSWPTAARTPSPSGSGRRRSPSPPTTADSSVANTARRASRSRSRRASGRSPTRREARSVRPVRSQAWGGSGWTTSSSGRGGRGSRSPNSCPTLDAQLQRDAGISHAAYIVLAMLSEAPNRGRRMSDLARRANQSQSRLSHTVTRLEERGWVRRERAAEDGRGALAVLTDAGWDVVRAVAPGHVDAVREAVFGPLTDEQARGPR